MIEELLPEWVITQFRTYPGSLFHLIEPHLSSCIPENTSQLWFFRAYLSPGNLTVTYAEVDDGYPIVKGLHLPLVNNMYGFSVEYSAEEDVWLSWYKFPLDSCKYKLVRRSPLLTRYWFRNRKSGHI